MFRREKKVYIERVKNILIVVLSFTAVLLLSFFWQDVSLEDLNPINLDDSSENSYIPEVEELVHPKYILFNYGTELYTILRAGDSYGEHTVYDEVKSLVRAYMENASSCEKIEADQYQEVMSYASFNMRFEYNIPLAEYLDRCDITSSVSLNEIPEITSIGFSSASGENLFIRDRKTDAYYRVILEDEEKISELSGRVNDFIKAVEQSSSVPYYNVSNIVGVENDALMPLYMPAYVTQISGEKEFSIGDQTEISQIASAFFASGLDFVRKITENKGSILYMYGSSQSLLMEEDGSLKYDEKLGNYSYQTSDFYGSLEAVIDYVGRHGGWENLYQSGMKPYLKAAEPVESSDCKGYRFEFGLEYDGVDVEYTGGVILSAEVYGSQITSYQRDILIVSEPENAVEEWYAMAPIDILTNNYEKICSIVSTGTFEEMTADIQSIKFCCMRDEENDPLKIKPAWLIIMNGGHKLWFDAEDGTLLSYREGAEVK